jgi:competence protein ComEA
MRHLFSAFVFAVSVLGVAAHANTAKETAKVESVQVKETKVNVNTANAQQIAKTLNGIGIKKAEAIVAYRNQNGPFKSATELMKVKGVGAATLQKNANLIAFN